MSETVDHNMSLVIQTQQVSIITTLMYKIEGETGTFYF